MENVGSKRLAILVGCNYANTPNELYGCINDVLAMKEVLINRFGFKPHNIQLLTDAPGSPIMPTGAKIKEALGCMVDNAEPGDVLYFHYSGHGMKKDGLEVIVPCDLNIVTRVDFRKIVNRVPKGASLTILSDSCHSGGLIDKEKEQIGPSSLSRDHIPTLDYIIKPRTIPYETLVHQLSSMTQIESPNLGPHLLELFGEDASLSFSMRPLELDSLPLIDEDAGILLSGCQSDEYCADIHTGKGGNACGAFSNAVLIVLDKNPNSALTNKEIVLMAREVVQKQFPSQHPCLYCSDDHVNSRFLNQLPK